MPFLWQYKWKYGVCDFIDKSYSDMSLTFLTLKGFHLARGEKIRIFGTVYNCAICDEFKNGCTELQIQDFWKGGSYI